MNYSIYWEVLVIGGLALTALITAIVKPLIALNRTLVTLDASIKSLGGEFKEHAKENKEEHKEINNKLDDHETRLVKVEGR